MRKGLVVACRVLGGLLLVVAFALMAMGYYQTWITEGFAGIQRLFNPFNISNFVMTILVLAPGAGLLVLGEKIRKGGEGE